jgi:hypothetical protein
MFSRKDGIVRKFAVEDSTAPFMFRGRVVNVHPASLSVDVYIPLTNKTYRGVYFGEGVLSKSYRSGGLPDTNSEVVVVSYSRTEAPIVVACIPSGNLDRSKTMFEYIYPGEYQILSSGAAYSKFDGVGNAYVGGADSASITETFDGSSIKYQKKDVNITNFSKKELRTQLKDDIISVYGSADIYEKSEIPRYSAETILSNPSLKDSILKDAENISAVLFGSNFAGEAPTGRHLFDCLKRVFDAASNLTDFESDLEIYKMRAQYLKLEPKGTHLSFEVFGDKAFSVKLLDESDTTISGITIGEDGGHLIGDWN